MKQYLTIFAALLSYGCVTQQPKESSPSQDNTIEVDSVKDDSIKVESKHTSSTNQTDAKVTKTIVTKTSSKTIPDKKAKTQVTKKQPVKPSKTTMTTMKSVKSDSSQLSPSTQVKPKVTPEVTPKITPIIVPETSIETQTIESTPLSSNKSSNNVEPDNSVKVDSDVTQIVVPESNLETETKTEIEIEQQVIENTLTQTNNLDFNLEKLPLSFGDTWFLDRNKDKVSNSTRCLLSSLKKNFDDGYSDSKMSLQLTSNTLLIKTKSSIDLSYPDIGIYIDQNEPFPLENLFGETNILIKKNIQQITAQLLNGEKLTVKLGFWPTWPKTETRSLDFLLSDFNKAYQAFLACEKL